MAELRPKFPESLPPPVEITEGLHHVNLTVADLANSDDIQGLVSDLYWYADDLYYLFFKHGEGVGGTLSDQMESQGIGLRTTELYFYRHPRPAHQNDFIRLLPGEVEFDWQRRATEGQMYGRLTLSLEPWKLKQLDIAQTAQATTKAIANDEPVLEVKPNFWGISINFHSLFRKLKDWWRTKQKEE